MFRTFDLRINSGDVNDLIFLCAGVFNVLILAHVVSA